MNAVVAYSLDIAGPRVQAGTSTDYEIVLPASERYDVRFEVMHPWWYGQFCTLPDPLIAIAYIKLVGYKEVHIKHWHFFHYTGVNWEKIGWESLSTNEQVSVARDTLLGWNIEKSSCIPWTDNIAVLVALESA